MQPDDDVQKRLLEKPRFELAAKGVGYSDWEDVTDMWGRRYRSAGGSGGVSLSSL